MYGNAFKLRVLLSEQLVLLSLAAKKFIMAHQFKQMYCEEITDIKKTVYTWGINDSYYRRTDQTKN